MGRKPRSERIEDFDDDQDDRTEAREAKRESRDDFENDMFIDELSSPFHVPQSEWGDGMIMRWISVEVTGAPDNRNWSLKTAAHWTPVPRGKYPKIDNRFPTTPMPGSSGANDGVIVFGGLCLCERDIRYSVRDKKNQEKATRDAARTIETYVEGGNSNMPRFNQSRDAEFVRGRPIAFKD